MNDSILSDAQLDMNTVQIAQIYENQGHYEDAYKIYAALDAKQSSPQTREGLKRTQDYVSSSDDTCVHAAEDSPGKLKITSLLEEWLTLLSTQHRLENYKKLKASLLYKNDA